MENKIDSLQHYGTLFHASIQFNLWLEKLEYRKYKDVFEIGVLQIN